MNEEQRANMLHNARREVSNLYYTDTSISEHRVTRVLEAILEILAETPSSDELQRVADALENHRFWSQ